MRRAGGSKRTSRAGRQPLGQGDCEHWRATGVGQPTNTATSVALVVGGLWVMRRARAVDPARRWRPLGYGGLLAAAGLGSVAYHGLGGTPAERAHDWSINLLAVATVLGEAERALAHRAPRLDAPRGPGRDRRPRGPAAVALTAGLVAPIAYALGRTSASTCRPTSRWQWHGLWHVLAAVAGTAWAEWTQVLPHVAHVTTGSSSQDVQGPT